MSDFGEDRRSPNCRMPQQTGHWRRGPATIATVGSRSQRPQGPSKATATRGSRGQISGEPIPSNSVQAALTSSPGGTSGGPGSRMGSGFLMIKVISFAEPCTEPGLARMSPKVDQQRKPTKEGNINHRALQWSLPPILPLMEDHRSIRRQSVN